MTISIFISYRLVPKTKKCGYYHGYCYFLLLFLAKNLVKLRHVVNQNLIRICITYILKPTSYLHFYYFNQICQEPAESSSQLLQWGGGLLRKKRMQNLFCCFLTLLALTCFENLVPPYSPWWRQLLTAPQLKGFTLASSCSKKRFSDPEQEHVGVSIAKATFPWPPQLDSLGGERETVRE